MLWKSGNVELRIWPLDHCPPHVTAVCRPDAWTARFQFSMVAEDVSLWDVKPLRNAPSLRMLNGLAEQIHANRLLCRTFWWQTQQTLCLDNAPVQRSAESGAVSLLPAGSTGAGFVVKGSGVYIPGEGVQVRVNWADSITTEWIKEF